MKCREERRGAAVAASHWLRTQEEDCACRQNSPGPRPPNSLGLVLPLPLLPCPWVVFNPQQFPSRSRTSARKGQENSGRISSRGCHEKFGRLASGQSGKEGGVLKEASERSPLSIRDHRWRDPFVGRRPRRRLCLRQGRVAIWEICSSSSSSRRGCPRRRARWCWPPSDCWRIRRKWLKRWARSPGRATTERACIISRPTTRPGANNLPSVGTSSPGAPPLSRGEAPAPEASPHQRGGRYPDKVL